MIFTLGKFTFVYRKMKVTKEWFSQLSGKPNNSNRCLIIHNVKKSVDKNATNWSLAYSNFINREEKDAS